MIFNLAATNDRIEEPMSSHLLAPLLDSHQIKRMAVLRVIFIRTTKKPVCDLSQTGCKWRRRELHPRPETLPSGRLRVCPIIWFSSGSPQQAGFRSAYPVIFSHQSSNRRLISGQPELASPNMTLGPKSYCGASSLLRQQDEEFEC